MQKPPSLTTITEWQQPAQHNTYRQKKRDSGEGWCKKAETETERKTTQFAEKVHTQRAQIRGATNYLQLDHELNFREIIGHSIYLC